VSVDVPEDVARVEKLYRNNNAGRGLRRACFLSSQNCAVRCLSFPKLSLPFQNSRHNSRHVVVRALEKGKLWTHDVDDHVIGEVFERLTVILTRLPSSPVPSPPLKLI